MSYSDFLSQGYRILQELGRNREGGRITWLVSNLDTSNLVVIKQFCFAQAGSSWSGFQAHQREIDVLKGLNHPGIPKYLTSFATSDGFCLVQEYINAPTLASQGSFDSEDVKQIAIKALEILVYLQNLHPSVIHRDIKPENILVDEKLNVYIIDFGFARIGSQEVAASSVFKGTPGFIPPEQMFKPTNATDLYALGVTLICLLSGIKSTKVGELQDKDDPYLIKFQHLLPRLSLRFLGWLESMVQPRIKDRFSNAQVARDALKPLDVVRIPGVEFSKLVLEFTASYLGENCSQNITVENPISDTVLQGKWVVASHLQDPPHTPDSHPWISVYPVQFRGNNTVCRVQVDTSKLMAGKLYERQLLLHTNAYPEIHPISVKVQTAALPIEKRKTPYAGLALVMLASATISGILIKSGVLSKTGYLFGTGATAIITAVVSDLIEAEIQTKIVNLIVLWANLTAASWVLFGIRMVARMAADVVDMVGTTTSVLLIFAAGLGTSFGIGFIFGFLNPYILLAITVTGFPLATMLLHPIFKQRQLIAKYRHSEEHLIKP